MRHHIIAASALSLLCLAGTTGVAEAQPTSGAHGPSAMVLTIAQGSGVPTDTILRAATLSCAYTAEGTHPAPRPRATPQRHRRRTRPPPGDTEPVTRLHEALRPRHGHRRRRPARSARRMEAHLPQPCAMSRALNGSPVYAF